MNEQVSVLRSPAFTCEWMEVSRTRSVVWYITCTVYLTEWYLYCLSDFYSHYCDDIVALWKLLIPLREWYNVCLHMTIIKHYTSILICNQILLLWNNVEHWQLVLCFSLSLSREKSSAKNIHDYEANRRRTGRWCVQVWIPQHSPERRRVTRFTTSRSQTLALHTVRSIEMNGKCIEKENNWGSRSDYTLLSELF